MQHSSQAGSTADLTCLADGDFRVVVRDWLERHLRGDYAGLRGAGGPGREHEDFDRRLAWDRALHQAGWTPLSWPREHGGTGATLSQQLIFHEECATARAPPGSATWGSNCSAPP